MTHKCEKETSPSLDDLLARAGLRPADVIFALRVSYSTVAKWRDRAGIPRGDRLLELADLIGVAPAEVLAAVEPLQPAAVAPSAPNSEIGQ